MTTQQQLPAVTTQQAAKVFGIDAPEMDFPVPVFDERAKNVPDVDPNYQFRVEYLLPVLWGLVNNKNTWLSGHTGSGKSTLIAQICARLNWPMIRVNFDSEISRMDLVGRDVLQKDESGVTVSKFVDGILPQALQQPCVLLCDEVDFIRPDVAYVFQRALEDDGLLISEDGGRVIKPHPMSRIIATANTQGQGDDFGIYQGARAQSMAFLDRFTVWVKCEYLPLKQEAALIKKLVPDADDWLMDQVMSYVNEHRQAFNDLKVAQPLSPRGIVSLTQLASFYQKTDKKPLLRAAKDALLNKCNDSDRNTLVGILDRVCKEKQLDLGLDDKKAGGKGKGKGKKADSIYEAKVEPEKPKAVFVRGGVEEYDRMHGEDAWLHKPTGTKVTVAAMRSSKEGVSFEGLEAVRKAIMEGTAPDTDMPF